MTPIEFFWGLAVNWASSAAESGLKQALPQSNYLTLVAQVFHKTVEAFTKTYLLPTDAGKKYPFYESQTFYSECLKFRFYENLDAAKILEKIQKDDRIIKVNEDEIAHFLHLLKENISQNAEIKATFVAEHYQAEIFTISQEIQKIATAFQQKANIVTINGSHNIVLQNLENIQEVMISLQGSHIEQTVREKEKLKNYQAQLATEYEAPIWGEAKMSLKDTYIEQKFGIYRECGTFTKNEKDAFAPTYTHLHSFINEWIITRRFVEDKKIKVQNDRLILLLGQPGQGKSSFCKRLMYDIFHLAELQSQATLRINFRDITDTNDLIHRPFQALLDFINNEKNIHLTEDYFRNCLFVLDGLDELRIKENMSVQVENEFLSNLSTNLKHNYPNIRVILTSRYHVQTERFKNEFLILNLSLLKETEQRNWLRKYCQFHQEVYLDTKTLSQFQKIPHLRELCEQPILLYMLAQTHSQEKPIDAKANRATIYDLLFEQVIERKWSAEGQIERLKGLDVKTLRLLLREIGFAIFQSENEYLHKTQIQKIVADNPKLERANDLLTKDALKGLMMAFYIQETRKAANDTDQELDNHNFGIEFMHKSLQEYLAAEKIWVTVKSLIAKDTEGDYLIYKGDACLKIFYQCFHRQFITPNIEELLLEIIAAEKQDIKTALADRIEKFLPYCLDHDFLYAYDLNKDKNPISHSLNIFYGTWTIFSHLQAGRNYITDNTKEKFVYLLKCLRGYKSDCKLNLSYCDLSHAHLSYADLRQANLSYADLRQANLSYADLRQANLSEADLRQANLSYADLRQANLSYADLRQANLSYADLRQADLSHASLWQANLSQTNLSHANLSHANLSEANLSEADLRQADLRQANLWQAHLNQADLRQANLSEAGLSWADLNHADLSDANLSEANLSYANLSYANLGHANLIVADLSKADLRRADLSHADLSHANLSEANLMQANLSEANLSNVRNLTFSQLSQTSSLVHSKGLPPKLEKELREKCPHLFGD